MNPRVRIVASIASWRKPGATPRLRISRLGRMQRFADSYRDCNATERDRRSMPILPRVESARPRNVITLRLIPVCTNSRWRLSFTRRNFWYIWEFPDSGHVSVIYASRELIVNWRATPRVASNDRTFATARAFRSVNIEKSLVHFWDFSTNFPTDRTSLNDYRFH